MLSSANRVTQVLRKQENLLKLGYLSTCFLISIPIISGVWNFIYSNGVPSGGDPADHALFILQILKTGRPLIAYSQFPELPSSVELAGVGYYPSLFHIIVAILTVILGMGSVSFTTVLNTMQAFVFIQYLIGICAYALLIHAIIDKALFLSKPQNPKFRNSVSYYGLLVLAFGLFIYSTSPIIKTFRDGGYGEILSMWCILPIYLYFLLNKRWIIAAILFAATASTHNLSFVMTVAASLPFFALLVIDRDIKSLSKSKNFLLVFLILFLPALVFFYAPTALSAYNSNTGQSVPVPRDYVIEQIKPNLYYAALIGSVLILFFNYRRLAWLTGWGGLYFPLFSSSIFAERFAREVSLPFGLILGIAVSIGVYKLLYWFSEYSVNKESKYIFRLFPSELFLKRSAMLLVPVIIIVLSSSYLYFSDRFASFSDPAVLNYYNKAFAESHAFVNNLNLSNSPTTGQENGRITGVLFGVDPWLKPSVYNKMRVLEVLPAQDEQSLSAVDRGINKSLRSILQDPNSTEAIKVIKEYNIHYIFISDLLPGRWYDDSYVSLNSQMLRSDLAREVPYAQLVHTSSDEGMQTRIYVIDMAKLNISH